MGAVLPEQTTKDVEKVALPAEFILHLGASSLEHVDHVAQTLRRLGAEVQVEANGSLVAFRPLL